MTITGGGAQKAYSRASLVRYFFGVVTHSIYAFLSSSGNFGVDTLVLGAAGFGGSLEKGVRGTPLS